MQPVDDVAGLTAEIERIKRQAVRFTTNWLVTPGQVQGWVKRGILFQATDTDAIIIFRRDRDFFHLYHAAVDHDRLSTALGSVGNLTVTTDIVGLPDDVSEVAATYLRNGFRERRTLIRMVRLGAEPGSGGAEDGEVLFAEPADASEVSAFFDLVLDPLADQIPDLDELREMAAQRKILMVRRGQAVGGVLVYEATGLTSLLRYWYVNPAYRDQGIGAQLIKTFFHLSRGAKRILLWVVSDNEDAIARYQHYGFQRERLVDCVLTKNGMTK